MNPIDSYFFLVLHLLLTSRVVFACMASAAMVLFLRWLDRVT